ncbi:DNA-3-methyladenine glycosylase family protein [Paenibacillus sp. GXUN7292]|uniref:DNA-3-methyladenine glycosylase family protein n=1 Tax=Paenibacillus sp. GXUN7292 TaxID=3422499 RepID=UPI003D7D4327
MEAYRGTVNTKWFDYGQTEIDYLSSADETLGEAMRRMGKIERVVMPDLFTAIVYAIVGQLISVKAVDTIWERMQARLGEITPSNILRKNEVDIQACGMTMKKAIYIKNIAQTVAHDGFQLEELHELPDEEVIKKLTALSGVGKWTAEMLLMNGMERPDVVSWGDIAIRRGMMKLYGLSTLDKEQFEYYRQKYSPYGSVASIYLWAISFET